MMKKKIITPAMLLLMTLIIPFNKCYAGVGLSVGVNLDVEGEQDFDEDGNPRVTISDFQTDGDISYTCQYSYKFDYSHETEIDVFNKKGDSIIYEENDKIKFNEKILSGTMVGIKIHETKSISWEVKNVNVSGVKNITRRVCTGGYKCYKTVIPTFCPTTAATIFGFKIPFLRIETQCPPETVECTCGSTGCGAATCPGGYSDVPSTEAVTDIPEEIVTACQNKGESEIGAKAQASMHPSYVVKLRNANYIDAGIENTDFANEDYIVAEIESGNGCRMSASSKSGTCHYYYSVKKTCLNAKTGKVRYITGSDNCDSDEITIEPNNNTWQYFTPLDTTSNDTFGISLVYKNEKGPQPVDYCKRVIDLKSNYWDYIKDINNRKFSEDKRETIATIERQEGCILDTEVVFDIEQKFYNELENGDFKGFNFYYKPIPTNLSSSVNIEDKVFPNGITDNSLWKDWYDATKDNKNPLPNLKNNDVSYIANIYGNVGKIREYNSAVPYTTWEFMKPNGESLYIENEGIIETDLEEGDFYKLGCGPANENQTNSDGSTNYLYQERCDPN